MDATTLDNSLFPQENLFDFQNRQFVYLPDQNNGSYPSGQVTFDLASLSNSGKYVDWSSSFLSIPIVMNLNSSSGSFIADTENVFAMSLKNGVHQLINSIQCEITNNSVVNLTNFSNLDINYKLLTSMSTDDVANLAPSILFGKDSAESFSYSGGSTAATSLGEINNNIKSVLFSPSGGWGATEFAVNQGRIQRMKYTSFDPAATQVAKYTDTDKVKTTFKNYATYSTTNITYYILATIPLRILHDIFRKLQLTKGMYMRLLLNTNTNVEIQETRTAGTGVVTAYTLTKCPASVTPFIISPASGTATTGNSSSTGFVNGTTTKTIATINIGSVTTGAGTTLSHSITQCRLYGCVYEMTPLMEQKYLSVLPQKKILYNDILSFQVLNTATNSQFSQILTNGISRARYLLIVPQHAAATHGSTNPSDTTLAASSIISGTPMSSPYTSSPATCLPYSSITNFNVLESGVAHYQTNINYKFENWLEEIRGSNSLQGGLQLGLSSGILSQQDYENGYGFIYVDLSRKQSQASDDVARSIQIVGTNSSKASVDLYCIIGYEREITVNTANGSLVI